MHRLSCPEDPGVDHPEDQPTQDQRVPQARLCAGPDNGDVYAHVASLEVRQRLPGLDERCGILATMWADAGRDPAYHKAATTPMMRHAASGATIR